MNKRYRKALVHLLTRSTAGMTKEKVTAMLPMHDEVTKHWTLERCVFVYAQLALDNIESGKFDFEIEASWNKVFCHGVSGWNDYEVNNKEIPTIW